MKILPEWSLETETRRIADTCVGISNGFFRLNSFLPLPWNPQVKYLASGVYLPVLPYTTIPTYWTKISKIRIEKNHDPLPPLPKQLDSLDSMVKSLALTPPHTIQLQQQANILLPKIAHWLKINVPGVHLPNTITIHPTYFGTGGSFTGLNPQISHLDICLRIDRNIRTIVECYLTSILRQSAMSELSATWSETEFLVDWLIHSSSLSGLLPPDPTWKGTINNLRTHLTPTQIALSHQFLNDIGAPATATQHFSLHNNQVYFNNHALTSFTARENALMSLLIAKSPTPTSIDEIANTIFPNDDKFSLAAINKTVERLRTKLNLLGISPSYLATANGLGYYLKN